MLIALLLRFPCHEHRESVVAHQQRHRLFLLVLLLLLLLFGVVAQRGLYGGEYCDTEVFRAECPEGEVILLERARYGRMRLGRCVEIDLGYVGCVSDVLAEADARCSGKRVCEIRIPDAEFEASEPCMKELKTYLDASYQCVTVQTTTTEHCRTHDELEVTSTSGFLSSAMTSDTPLCDGSSHPWTIIGKPGQRVELTLYDFNRPPLSRPAAGKSPAEESAGKEQTTGSSIVCLSYGLIEDNEREKPMTICGDTKRRVSNIFRSSGNVLKVWITPGGGSGRGSEEAAIQERSRRFLIQFSVVGCGNPDDLPDGYSFIRRSNGNGVVTCHDGTTRTRMECLQNNTWKKMEETGSYNNCSTSKSMANRTMRSETPSLQLVVSLVVLVGSVAGATVLILTKMFTRFRRTSGDACRKRQNEADFRRDLLNDDVTTLPQPMISHAGVITEPLIDAASHHHHQQTTAGKGAKCYNDNGAMSCAELPLCTVHRCAVCEDSYAPENELGLVQADSAVLSSFGKAAKLERRSAWTNNCGASYINLTSDV